MERCAGQTQNEFALERAVPEQNIVNVTTRKPYKSLSPRTSFDINPSEHVQDLGEQYVPAEEPMWISPFGT